MTRSIGFSTGAIGNHDVVQGITATRALGCRVIELSVLRDQEFAGFMEHLGQLDLREFDYCSVHAPGKFQEAREQEIILELSRVAQRTWPIVLHPDAIHRALAWRWLGPAVLIENMDSRKPTGQSAISLGQWLQELPGAGWCFDIGHAFQVDSTGQLARDLLNQHGGRLRQVHVSTVDLWTGHHGVLTDESIRQFQSVAHLIPNDIPVIIESPVEPDQMAQEILAVQRALPSAI